VPLQIMAYHSGIIDSLHAKRLAREGDSLLGGRILDLLSADHHAIDAETYRELGEVFTTAQIIELGFTCAEVMGVHRFIHTLDIFGETSPAIPFSPEQIDARR
jgi:hypothetical protein